MKLETDANLKDNLKEIFGYNQFRGNQEKIIQSLMGGKNTFVIMPTGAGKSLCYQLPAVIMEGTAIVISPLIALMKNQVDQLKALGINARFLNSTLSKSEMNRVKKETIEGKVKLLYVAPESLNKEDNIKFLRSAKLSFVAIDEAHCISEWGHDFRPEYRRIRSIVDKLGNLSVIALTATATPKVQMDIQKNLVMEESEIFKSSFNRQNLFYEVRPKSKDVDKELIKFVKKHKHKSGIVYCLSRKKVEKIAELLQVNDIKARPYHAGLDASVRMQNQDAFLNEDVDVIVATIAFGMGIDKPDVRFVVHYDAPKSIEGYYQETGRAGRDGLEGHCLMFYSYSDILKLEKFNKDKPVTERDNAKHLLQEMAAYSESSVCRRLQLLHYFGETFDQKNCNQMCDNCCHGEETFDGRDFVVSAIKAVRDTEERFESNHIVDVIRGKMNQYVESYGHNDLEVFGQGENRDEDFWHTIIRQAMLRGLLKKDIEKIDVMKVSKNGHSFIKKPAAFEIIKDHNFERDVSEAEAAEEEMNNASYDEVLFDMLRKLRKKEADARQLPPYVIFQEPSLKEMATIYPKNRDELAQVNGVGQGKVMKFGRPFIDLINKYVEENEITTATDVVVKSTANKSKIKIFIIQQIDRQVDLEEIAEAKNMSMDELIEEIEHICYSGTKLNLDYYLDQVMDFDRQSEISEYFMEAQTDKIAEALEEFDEDYSEEELRLMRVQFMSEYAM